jgi:hypothetical protein
MSRISVSRAFVLPALALAAGCQHLPTELPYAVADDCTVQRVAAAPPGSPSIAGSDTTSPRAPLRLASAEGLIGATLVAAATSRGDDVRPLPPRPVRDAVGVVPGRAATGGVGRSPTGSPGAGVPQPPPRGGSVGFPFIGIVLPAAAAPAPPTIAEQLAEEGPHLPAAFSMSCAPVHGFVGAGWPVALDYRPGPDTDVVLEIHAPAAAPHVLPLDSTPRRQLVQLHLPPALGETPQVALLLVRASRRDGSGAGGMQLYGLAVGARAVASVAIDQVNFRPGEIRVSRKQQASYSFFSRTDFNRTTVEILRVQRQGDEIRVSLARATPLQVAVNRGMWVGKEQPLTWDGFDEQRRMSSGAHLLQVRAWLNAQDEHDWVAAWSPDMVLVAE